MKQKNKVKTDKIRLIAIAILCLFVIATGTLYAVNAFENKDIAGAVVGVVIAITIIVFALFLLIKGNRDVKEGYPLKDERSKRVLEKASSMAFYITLYLLLAIGFLSDSTIKFRDVSQATSVAVGGMTLLFLILWIYYNKKEI